MKEMAGSLSVLSVLSVVHFLSIHVDEFAARPPVRRQERPNVLHEIDVDQFFFYLEWRWIVQRAGRFGDEEFGEKTTCPACLFAKRFGLDGASTLAADSGCQLGG